MIRLLLRQVGARLLSLVVTAAVMVGAAYLATHQVQDVRLLPAALVLLGLVPLYNWLLGGLSALTLPRGRSGVSPASLPNGHAWAWASYLRLLLDIALLTGVWFAVLLYFGGGVLPLRDLAVPAREQAPLAWLLLAALVGPPATALAAGAVGRTSRAGGLAGFVAFVVLSGAWWVFSSRLAAVTAGPLNLGAVNVPLLGVPDGFCTGQCVLHAGVAVLAFQPVWAVLLLLLAGWTLSGLRPARPVPPNPAPPAESFESAAELARE